MESIANRAPVNSNAKESQDTGHRTVARAAGRVLDTGNLMLGRQTVARAAGRVLRHVW
jgi:hypothetical protein